MAGVPTNESKHRVKKKRWLIVGEGRETEYNYFNAMREDDAVSERFDLVVKKGPGWDQETIVRYAVTLKDAAEKSKDPYHEHWCVLDVEGPGKSASLKKAITLAKQSNISLCLSNPAFEIWFLLHFERKAPHYNDCAAVIVELNKHWSAVFKNPYDKSERQIFERLRTRMPNAIKNAEWLLETRHQQTNIPDCNPSTDVHRLVKRFLPNL